MNDYEQLFEQELLQKLNNCQTRRTRLQYLEGDIIQELTLLEQE